MQTGTTEAGMWVRGAIYVATAMGVFLQADEGFRATGAVDSRVIIGASVTGLIALRAYLDISPARGDEEQPTEVKVINEPQDAVPTDPIPPHGEEG